MIDKTSVPKYIVMIIILIVVAIMVGGYALYFKAEKHIVQKDREYEILKEKSMHAEENYNDLMKKYDGTSDELKQVNKDYEGILQKHQECKEKQEELQTKLDIQQQLIDKLKKDLQEARTKLGLPQEATSESDHPLQYLNKENKEKEAQAINKSDAAAPAYHCPISAVVTANASQGTWQEDQITWFVDFTSRPLNEHEAVKALFKILYDGQSVACYYALGEDSDNVWMVVKGDNKNKKVINISEKGWAPCPTDECKSLCSKENLNDCSFSLGK